MSFDTHDMSDNKIDKLTSMVCKLSTQVPEQILIEIELNAPCVGNRIIFDKDCPNVTVTEKDQTKQLKQMLDSEEQETTLKVLVCETSHSLTRAHSEKMIKHLN